MIIKIKKPKKAPKLVQSFPNSKSNSVIFTVHNQIKIQKKNPSWQHNNIFFKRHRCNFTMQKKK
jgi:hypothetical protein